MRKIIAYLLARVREPSTWAGLTGIVVGVATVAAGNPVQGTAEIMGGLGAVLIKEGAK